MRYVRLLPLALLALLFLFLGDSANADGPFTPTFSMTGDEIAPADPTIIPVDDECPVSAPCKVLYAEDIPDGQWDASITVLAPSAIQQFAGDAIVPDGAVIGHVVYSHRQSDYPETCFSAPVVDEEFDYLEGTTDHSTTTGSPSDLYSYSNWPAQLDAFRDSILSSYTGSVLHSRWVRPAPSPGPGNVLVFKLADGSLLYAVAPVGDPTLPPSYACGPITIRYVALGVSADNPATPQDEGGIPLVSCGVPGTQTYQLSLDPGDTPPGDPVVLEDTIACSSNTPDGTAVSVPLNGGTDVLAGIDVTFSNVTSGGSTTVITTTTGPPPPTGFKIVGLAELPLYFDINTDATYSGDLSVCVRYDETQVTGPEADLKLMQRVDSNFVDVTTSVDTANDIICGATTHLSIFVIAELSPPGPPAVGGVVELQSSPPDARQREASGSDSPLPYVALASGITAIALAAGGWCARKRWPR